ncbi:hypothetical protein B0H13DRAFT_1920308 [Mycena leptocephala]|nr:hypothetical protein B0H13DRAFT_1920308 [Mycena leptocephala]
MTPQRSKPWVCEVAHAVCIGHTLYTYTIFDYGHPERLGVSERFLLIAAVFDGVIGACVQGFFAFRIYRLSNKLHIPILCWVLSFLRVLGDIVLLATAAQKIPVEIYEAHWMWLFTALCSVSAANDLVITVTLVTILVRQRTYAHKRTVALMDKLIVWTIVCYNEDELHLACGICCDLKTYSHGEIRCRTPFGNCHQKECFSPLLSSVGDLCMDKVFISQIVTCVSSEVVKRTPFDVYSNSLLASLNSRTKLRAVNEVSLPYSTPVIGFVSGGVKVTQITYDTEPIRDQSNESTSEDRGKREA